MDIPLNVDTKNELMQLVQQIDFAQDEFALFFAQVNSPIQRDKLISELKIMLGNRGIDAIDLFLKESIRDLLTLVRESFAAHTVNKSMCILVTGLELSIHREDSVSEIFAHLNLARELYRIHVPIPIVIWLPEYALTELARKAPDFWAWRSGVFEFEPSIIVPIGDTSFDKLINLAGREIQKARVNLAPSPPPDFTGREKELVSLSQTLTRGNKPLIVNALLGMGGIGKSALAAKLAADLSHKFPGGVLWVNMSEYNGASVPILQSWARACGQDVSETSQIEELVQQTKSVLEKHVKENGELFIVLDNVQPEWVESTKTIISSRPLASSLLITTRSSQVAAALGATIYRLNGLTLDQGLRLLAEMIEPDRVIREREEAEYLVTQLDGLPLAIKLIGALAAYKPELSLAKVGDQIRFQTQVGKGSLAASLAISFEGLTPDSQELMRHLSVFSPHGSFDIDAVCYVVNKPLQTVKTSLKELVRAGLLEKESETRYRMHPLIHTYAENIMLTPLQETTRIHYINHFLNLIMQHRLPSRENYDVLDTELPNILNAIDYAYEDKQWEKVNQFMWALTVTDSGHPGYLWMRGYWQELQVRFRQAIEAARAAGNESNANAFIANLAALQFEMGDLEAAWQQYLDLLSSFKNQSDQRALAVIYSQLGRIAYEHGNLSEAHRLHQQSLKIDKMLNNLPGVADSMQNLGLIAQSKGDYAKTRRLYQSSLKISEQLGDQVAIARALNNLGSLAQHQGNYNQAQELYQRALELYKVLGDQVNTANVLHQLGMLTQEMRDLDKAYDYYRDSLEISERLGNKLTVASTLHQLGMLAQEKGEYERANQLYQESLKIKEELGYKAGLAVTIYQLGVMSQMRGNYSEAQELYQRALTMHQEIGDRVGIARVSSQIANMNALMGNWLEAEKLYQETIKQFELLNDQLSQSYVLHNLGLLYEEQGHLEKAKSMFQKSLDIKLHLNSPFANQDLVNLNRVSQKLKSVP